MSGPSDSSSVSANFSLRVGTVNVCVFPLLTRNKTAVVQFFVGMITGMTLAFFALHYYFPALPLLPLLLSLPFIALPLNTIIIPIQALVVFILSRGQWHDHKRGRLDLLTTQFRSFDILAVQELFSGVFDVRYRDYVIAEAKKHGLHYVQACSRIPRFPAFLLNTGTMLLSRYPVTHSRNICFAYRAFYDYFIVNRGMNWMRIELPSKNPSTDEQEIIHVFTCHIAPPLAEVAGRVGDWIIRHCSCPQQKQLDELIQFIKDCVQMDVQSDAESKATGKPKRKIHILLAGDFNLDCGSLRYFSLLHALQTLSTTEFAKGQINCMHDAFAIEGEESMYTQMHMKGDVINTEEEEEEEDEEEQQRQKQNENTVQKRSTATTANTSASSPSPSSSSDPSSSSSSSAALRIGWNEWRLGQGNGKESYSEYDHAVYSSLLHRRPHLKWEATFGQKVLVRERECVCTGESQSCSQCCTHLETFLTHSTLLGSHSTHDYMFSNCTHVNQKVEPFLTTQAQKMMEKNQNQKEKNKNNHSAHDASSSSTPPFTQLSDHSALIATLLLPNPSQ